MRPGGRSLGCSQRTVFEPAVLSFFLPEQSRAISRVLPSIQRAASLPLMRCRYSSSFPVSVLRTALSASVAYCGGTFGGDVVSGTQRAAFSAAVSHRGGTLGGDAGLLTINRDGARRCGGLAVGTLGGGAGGCTLAGGGCCCASLFAKSSRRRWSTVRVCVLIGGRIGSVSCEWIAAVRSLALASMRSSLDGVGMLYL